MNNSIPTIFALDLGTHTGWAVRDNTGLISSGTMLFDTRRFEGGGMRYLRFKRWLTEVKQSLGNIDEVYFEEVRAHRSPGSNGKFTFNVDAAHAYGGFMAHLTAWCEHHNIPYQGVPVGTIKKHITGKGNSNKSVVIKAVKAKGFNPCDDNEADSLALLDFIISNQPREE